MRQIVTLLLFVIGFSAFVSAKPVMIVPAVTTTSLTTNVVQDGGFWNKLKTKVRNFFKSIDDDAITIAIIAHITIIGLVIAIVMNAEKKSDLATFYIRQVLGVSVLGLALSIILSLLSLVPLLGLIAAIVGFFLSIGLLVLLIISLLAAMKGEKKELPVVGKMFQKWFASIG